MSARAPSRRPPKPRPEYLRSRGTSRSFVPLPTGSQNICRSRQIPPSRTDARPGRQKPQTSARMPTKSRKASSVQRPLRQEAERMTATRPASAPSTPEANARADCRCPPPRRSGLPISAGAKYSRRRANFFSLFSTHPLRRLAYSGAKCGVNQKLLQTRSFLSFAPSRGFIKISIAIKHPRPGFSGEKERQRRRSGRSPVGIKT